MKTQNEIRLEKELDKLRLKVDKFLDEIIDDADGAPDAVGIGKYANSLVATWNEIMMERQ